MRDDPSILSIVLMLLCVLLLAPLPFYEMKQADKEYRVYKADEQRVKERYIQEKLDMMEQELAKNKPQGKVKDTPIEIPIKQIKDEVTALLDAHKEEYLKDHTITKKTLRSYMEDMYYYIEAQHVDGIQQVRMVPEFKQIEFVTAKGSFYYLLYEEDKKE